MGTQSRKLGRKGGRLRFAPVKAVRRFFQTSLILLLINLLVFPPWLSAQATATALTWTGAGDGGSFESPSNWNPSVTPSGAYDAYIQTLNNPTVNLTVGGFSLNSMTIGDASGDGATLNVSSNPSSRYALTLQAPNTTAATPTTDVLTINNGGTLNLQNGSSVLLDLSSGGTVTNNGSLNIGGNSTLVIQNNNRGPAPSITNNFIALGDANGAGTLNLSDGGNGSTFTISGTIQMSDNAGNLISGSDIVSNTRASGSASPVGGGTTLVLNNSATVDGAGTISVDNLTNNGFLYANGTNSLQVTGNLTNWNGSTQLTGGNYIASGSTLQLSSIGSNSIQTLSGNATVHINAGGLLTGDGSTDALSQLSNITDSGLTINATGSATTPYTITPTTGTLTITSNAGNSAFQLNGNSNVLVSGGLQVTGALEGQVTVDHGSTLTIGGNFANIDGSGVLSGGSYLVGQGSTLNYSGANITTIASGTAVTLGGPDSVGLTGQILNNGSDALASSLNTNLGNLTLQNNANVAIDIGTNSNSTFTNGISSPAQLPGAITTHDTTGDGVLNILSGSTLTIQDRSSNATANIYNYGTINLDDQSSGNQTTLAFDAGTNAKTFVLNGTGTLIGADSTAITIAGVTGSESLTNNSTIQGSAYISNFANFTNNGAINVQEQGTGMAVDLTNFGLSSVNTGTFTNGVGGTITVTDSGFYVVGSGATTLTNNGSISLNAGQCGCGGSLFLVDANQVWGNGGAAPTFTLSGTGTITMDTSGNSQIAGLTGTESLINDVGHTIQGSGSINNFVNFTNNGILNSTDGGAGLSIDLTGGESAIPNQTFTNNGTFNIAGGTTAYILTLGSQTITNNGNINIGDANGTGSLWLGSSDDGGSSATFTLTGTGTLTFNSAAGLSDIEGYIGTENLINDTPHTIAGNGDIDFFTNFTNNGTLHASGGQLQVDVGNFTNWDGTTGKLSGGTYIVDDGSSLMFTGLSLSTGQGRIHTNVGTVGTIQTLSGANVTLNGTGLLLDANSNDGLAGLTQIDQGTTGNGSLTLNNVGSSASPYTITTNALTVLANDSNLPVNGDGTTSASLNLNNSSMQISNGLGGFGDLNVQATSTQGNAPNASVVLVDSNLVVGNLSSTATSGPLGNAATLIQVSGAVTGSQLTVNGGLTNQATSTDATSVGALAQVSVSGGSTLHVTGDVLNTVTGSAANGVIEAIIDVENSTLTVDGGFTNHIDAGLAHNGFAVLQIGNGSTATVTGAFGNGAGSSVNILGSTLSTGIFTNNGNVTIRNGGTLNTSALGPVTAVQGVTTSDQTNAGFINAGTLTVGQLTKEQKGSVSTHQPTAPNTVNVTGNLFNTSAGVVNVYGAGDSINVSAPLTTCINACQQITGGLFQNDGTVNIIGNGSSIFADSYLQSGGTTTVDAGASLTAEVDIEGGLLTGGGTINGDVTIGGDGTTNGTISPGDPQSLSIIGNFAETQFGIMDLDLVVPDPGNIKGTQSDQINVTGSVTLNGTLDLTLEGGIDNFNPLLGTIFRIITWTGGQSGDFLTFNDPVFNHGSETFIESFVNNGGGNGELDLIVTGVNATPEPSTMAMFFGAALLGAGSARRKRRRVSRVNPA